MAKRLNKEAKELLIAISKGTNEAPVFVDTGLAAFKALRDFEGGPLIYTNEGARDANNHIAAVLSPAGIEKVKTAQPSRGPVVPPPDPASIPLLSAIPAWEAATRGGGGRPSPWPFDKAANVGDGFFIAATTERPEPWISLRSTVGSFNSKSKDAWKKAGGETNSAVPRYRVFRITEGEHGGVKGALVRRFE